MFRNHLVKAIPRLLLALWLAIGPAWAGSMTLLGVGNPGAAAPSFALTFQSKAGINDTAHTTVDYGSVFSYGSNTRIVAVLEFYENSTTTVSGVTVNGNALSHVSGSFANPGLNGVVAIDVWESTGSLTPGSLLDVQVTYSTTLNFTSAVALYALTTTTPIASAAQVNTATSATSVGVSITVPSGGGAIVATATNAGQTITSITSGTIDQFDTTGGARFTWGHTTSTGALTPTANWASSDGAAISVVAWGP